MPSQSLFNVAREADVVAIRVRIAAENVNEAPRFHAGDRAGPAPALFARQRGRTTIVDAAMLRILRLHMHRGLREGQRESPASHAAFVPPSHSRFGEVTVACGELGVRILRGPPSLTLRVSFGETDFAL